MKFCVLILAGADEQTKRRRIEQIQSSCFSPEIRDFNSSLLYADDKDFSAPLLQESLAEFPCAGASGRVIVIKAAQRMTKAVQEVLIDALKEGKSSSCVILDVAEPSAATEMMDRLAAAGAKVEMSRTPIPASIFDMGRAILDRKSELALKILHRVWGERERSEKILGALFWQWEDFHSRKRMDDETYRRGLDWIQETDRRLKMSSGHRREEMLLESLVVRLSCRPR